MRSIVLGIVATLAASPALANWQYTRWGMSPTEVVASSRGAARLPSAEEAAKLEIKGVTRRKTLAIGGYEADGRKFAIRFVFEEGRLAMVALDVINPADGALLLQSLSARYGAPVLSERIGLLRSFTWRDEKGGNIVELLDAGRHPGTAVAYSPLAAASGL